MNPEDFVTPEARFAEQVDERVRAPRQVGMAPYPLYGLGQEPAVPLWKRPWFCWSLGAALGFGACYLVFQVGLPKLRKNKTRRRRLRRNAEGEAGTPSGGGYYEEEAEAA